MLEKKLEKYLENLTMECQTNCAGMLTIIWYWCQVMPDRTHDCLNDKQILTQARCCIFSCYKNSSLKSLYSKSLTRFKSTLDTFWSKLGFQKNKIYSKNWISGNSRNLNLFSIFVLLDQYLHTNQKHMLTSWLDAFLVLFWTTYNHLIRFSFYPIFSQSKANYNLTILFQIVSVFENIMKIMN